MPKIKTHPQPCANCGHTELHGEVAGCIAVTSPQGAARTTWCDCDAYVSPRDRTSDRVEGVRRGTEGGDAALHGHTMTYDTTGWREAAEARLDALIDRGTDFTAEDVTDVVGVAPNPNAIGGLFKGAKARLEPAGFTTASRPEAHGRALRVWRGRPA